MNYICQCEIIWKIQHLLRQPHGLTVPLNLEFKLWWLWQPLHTQATIPLPSGFLHCEEIKHDLSVFVGCGLIYLPSICSCVSRSTFSYSWGPHVYSYQMPHHLKLHISVLEVQVTPILEWGKLTLQRKLISAQFNCRSGVLGGRRCYPPHCNLHWPTMALLHNTFSDYDW